MSRDKSKSSYRPSFKSLSRPGNSTLKTSGFAVSTLSVPGFLKSQVSQQPDLKHFSCLWLESLRFEPPVVLSSMWGYFHPEAELPAVSDRYDYPHRGPFSLQEYWIYIWPFLLPLFLSAFSSCSPLVLDTFVSLSVSHSPSAGGRVESGRHMVSEVCIRELVNILGYTGMSGSGSDWRTHCTCLMSF